MAIYKVTKVKQHYATYECRLGERSISILPFGEAIVSKARDMGRDKDASRKSHSAYACLQDGPANYFITGPLVHNYLLIVEKIRQTRPHPLLCLDKLTLLRFRIQLIQGVLQIILFEVRLKLGQMVRELPVQDLVNET